MDLFTQSPIALQLEAFSDCSDSWSLLSPSWMYPHKWTIELQNKTVHQMSNAFNPKSEWLLISLCSITLGSNIKIIRVKQMIINLRSCWLSHKFSFPLFCFTLLCDWSRKLAPLSQPIRCKTTTNHDLVAHIFLGLKALWLLFFFFEFWLALKSIFN